MYSDMAIKQERDFQLDILKRHIANAKKKKMTVKHIIPVPDVTSATALRAS